MEIIFSVAICTHNRSEYLDRCLHSVFLQSLLREKYEVIVVDNMSNDRTKEVVQKYPDAIYIYEPNLGVSYARNTAWKESKGMYVAYLDDDAIASANWLENALLVLQQKRVFPIGCLVGKIVGIWQKTSPSWLPSAFYHHLTMIDWGQHDHILLPNEWIAGANMIIPKSVLKDTQGFCLKLGRKGKKLLSLEENFFRYKIEKLNYVCYYSPTVLVEHIVHPERLCKTWFESRFFWGGVSNAIFEIETCHPSYWKRFSCGVYLLLRHIFSPYYEFIFWIPSDSPKRFQLRCFFRSII